MQKKTNVDDERLQARSCTWFLGLVSIVMVQFPSLILPGRVGGNSIPPFYSSMSITHK